MVKRRDGRHEVKEIQMKPLAKTLVDTAVKKVNNKRNAAAAAAVKKSSTSIH